MGVEIELVREKLTKFFSPSHLEVTDFSDGCGSKFNVVIVSAEFEGKTLIQRHR